VKAIDLREEAARESVFARFAAAGVARQRLELLGPLPNAADHLRTYHRIDIALDTFPYNGTTTTCESLWMGVPVVSLAGDRHASRVGASLLTAVGLQELIANSREEYVNIAAKLAGDLDRLAEIRSALRERMRESPLLDHAGFTRELEKFYRDTFPLSVRVI
jgi:predicted O-linked N-acetylglucosamine transferase (SPINDLY family)